MVKAEDLIKQQKEREDRKYLTFDKIYTHVEKKICSASSGNYYYTWFQVPEMLIGLPSYCYKECQTYIIGKLKKDGFETEFFEPNIILIKWFPKTKK